MTRLRSKAATDSQDGGAFHGNNRPPAEFIPAAFRSTFDEYDRLWERIQKTNEEYAELKRNWGELKEKARKADIAEAHNAARSGSAAPVTTPNQAALDAQLEQARANLNALEGALPLIANDLAEIRYSEQQNLAKYKAAETKARTELTKKLAALETPIQDLINAIALREWIESQYTWDTTANFDVVDLWAPASRLRIANKASNAVTYGSIVNALSNL
mgnify:CR=1 FL=1|tara:strand:+ start:3563 stop:4213 length:651 start_codon:yes stop_codon:yes gene_type:complete